MIFTVIIVDAYLQIFKVLEDKRWSSALYWWFAI